MFQVELTQQYRMYEWHEDIKGILKKATATELHSTFLFSDTQIKEESFLEDISNMLNSGEVNKSDLSSITTDLFYIFSKFNLFSGTKHIYVRGESRDM